MKKTIDFYKKYSEIINSVLVVALIFSVYFMGTCNGRKNAKSIIITDTTQAHIDRVEKHNTELKKTNDSLMIAVYQYKKELQTIKEQQQNNEDHISVLIHNIKELPIDNSVILMALNFTNKQSIKTTLKDGDTLISVHPKQVTEVNITYTTLDYYKQDNAYLSQELSLMTSTDTALSQIIENQNEMLVGKDDIILGNEKITARIKADLDLMTKKYKRQKFWKFVYKGGFIAAVVYAIIK